MTEALNEKPAEAQPEEKIVMQIILTRSGQVKVQGGIIADKIASYGLLQCAIEEIRKYNEPKIVKPVGGVMNFIRGNGHK